MQLKGKCTPSGNLLAQIKVEANDPQWVEGFQDGQLQGAMSAPDMSRGHQYALGFLTGRWVSVPASLLRH